MVETFLRENCEIRRTLSPVACFSWNSSVFPGCLSQLWGVFAGGCELRLCLQPVAALWALTGTCGRELTQWIIGSSEEIQFGCPGCGPGKLESACRRLWTARGEEQTSLLLPHLLFWQLLPVPSAAWQNSATTQQVLPGQHTCWCWGKKLQRAASWLLLGFRTSLH